MRLLSDIIIMLAVTAGSAAWAGVDARTMLATAEIEHTEQLRKARADNKQNEVRYTPLIVEFGDSDDLDRLHDDLGAVVLYTRGNLALTYIPDDKIGEMTRGNYVDSYAVSRRATANCDVARVASGIASLQNLPDLPYDGTGVVAGICDIGFDPSHIAFRDRLGMMSVYTDSLARRSVWAPGTPLDNGASLATDTDSETHATHVMNILGGNFRGNEYYGGATGAELAVSCSELSDVAVLAGIEDIIAYSRLRGKPCVINVSIGEYLGPHDGTDLVNRYLDMLGDEALICFSSGNNGAGQYGFRHTLGEDSPGSDNGLPTVGTMFENNNSWDGFGIRGATDVWCHDASPLDIRFVVFDQVECKTVWRSGWYGPEAHSDEAGSFSLSADNVPEIASILTGTTVNGAWSVSGTNNRFNISFDYTVETEAEIPGHHWARYTMGWEVRGQRGVSLDAYSDGVATYMRRYGTPGMIDGTSELSISNLCCGSKVISVGAWSTRNSAPVWGKDSWDKYGYDIDNVAAWSSYGTLVDGRRLPDVCAPGNTLVSAMSGPYLTAHPDAVRAYAQTVDGKEYSWFTMCGTSMASPALAAVLAAWCQKYPDLDCATARTVIAQTARRDFSDISDPRWGHGAADAVEGLRLLDTMNGISGITADGTDYTPEYFDLTGRQVTNPGVGIYIERRGTAARKITRR